MLLFCIDKKGVQEIYQRTAKVEAQTFVFKVVNFALFACMPQILMADIVHLL